MKRNVWMNLLCMFLAPLILATGWFAIRNLDRVLPDGTGGLQRVDRQRMEEETAAVSAMDTFPPFVAEGFPEGVQYLGPSSPEYETVTALLRQWSASPEGSALLDEALVSQGFTAGSDPSVLQSRLALWTDTQSSRWILWETEGYVNGSLRQLRLALSEQGGLGLLQLLPERPAAELEDGTGGRLETTAVDYCAAFLKSLAKLQKTNGLESAWWNGESRFLLSPLGLSMNMKPLYNVRRGVSYYVTFAAEESRIQLIYDCVTMRITGFARIP